MVNNHVQFTTSRPNLSLMHGHQMPRKLLMCRLKPNARNLCQDLPQVRVKSCGQLPWSKWRQASLQMEKYVVHRFYAWQPRNLYQMNLETRQLQRMTNDSAIDTEARWCKSQMVSHLSLL